MKKEWVISIRRQCRDQRVPFFFKQWGGVRKKQTGRLLDNRTYDEYPSRPSRPIPDEQSAWRARRRSEGILHASLPNPTSSSCPQKSKRFLLDAHATNQITYIRWHYLLDNSRSLTIRRFTCR
jgi:hypothetical protein